MKTPKIFIGIICLLVSHMAIGQGCVAIRSLSGCGTGTGSSAILKPGESLLGFNMRYFKSFRHFRGDHEEAERIENNTEVINKSYFYDLTFNYSFAKRYYFNLLVPYVYHDRSSLYEHGGNSYGDRHTTQSRGIADIRSSIGYWLFDEENNPKHNMALALGAKFPTGNYKATDVFYNVGTGFTNEVRFVDQSIQPGDGGFGATVDLYGFRQLSNSIVFNGSIYYLVNPRETNGISRSNNPSPSNIMSVPDQYAARLGFFYVSPIHGLDLYLGGRIEGIPVHDLVGGSGGFRRPGYVISLDPGINYRIKNFLLSGNVPVSMVRNRTQSVPDIEREKITGIPTHGDAAFADYLISFGISYKITKAEKMVPHEPVVEN